MLAATDDARNRECIRRMRNRSVRVVINLLICLLGGLTLLLAAFGLSHSLDSNALAERIVERNRVAGQCLKAVQDFSFERGRTSVLLRDADLPTADNRLFVDERRAGADQAIAAICRQLPELGIADAGLLRSWDGVRRLRESVDSDLRRFPGERSPTLPQRWSLAANDLIARLEAVLASLSRTPGEDSELALMNSARVLALQLRNATGIESNSLATSLATRTALDPGSIREVFIQRGRIAQLWDQLDQAARAIGNPRFSASVDQIREQFHGTLRPLQDDILRAFAEGRTPPVSAEQYGAATVRSLDLIINVVDGMDAMTGDHVARLLARSHWIMAWAGACTVAAICLVGATVLVTARRITLPLRKIMARIDRLHSQGADIADDPDGDEFTKVDQALDVLDASIQANARHAEALQEANRKLSELAVTDELTGLANRRRLNDTLSREWSRARRRGHSLAVLMIDIDHFKGYNDEFGHQAGDECLVCVARVLLARTRRAEDMVVRYGGEEFVVIIPHATAEEAARYARQLCRDMESLGLPHPGSPYGRVTVSIGVAAMIPWSTLRAEDLLRQADMALYQAKEDGRNRVVCPEQTPGDAD